jgi:hypothetical protein
MMEVPQRSTSAVAHTQNMVGRLGGGVGWGFFICRRQLYQ